MDDVPSLLQQPASQTLISASSYLGWQWRWCKLKPVRSQKMLLKSTAHFVSNNFDKDLIKMMKCQKYEDERYILLNLLRLKV